MKRATIQEKTIEFDVQNRNILKILFHKFAKYHKILQIVLYSCLLPMRVFAQTGGLCKSANVPFEQLPKWSI